MQAPSRSSRLSASFRWLRLAGFVFVIVALSAWWKARQVSADFRERTLAIGRQLESWKDPAAGASTITLNGQTLTLTSASSDASVGTILDRFSEQCARNSGGIAEQLRELAASGERLPEFAQRGRFGIYRAEASEHEGTAACFARGGSGGLADLMRRIELLVDSGDFASLGQLRYVFARRRPDASSTHVVSVSSHGSLPLVEMFPADGDAPGVDIVPDVRPAASRRVLAASLEGSAQRVALYESKLEAKAAVESYDAPLRARGFSRGDLTTVSDRLPVPVRVYTKPDDIVLVFAENDPRGHSTLFSFRLDDGGFVRLQP